MSICVGISASADDNASGEDFSWDDTQVETVCDKPFEIVGSTIVPNNTIVLVYDISGKLIARTDTAINLQSGIYIIKSKTSTYKISI